MSAWGEVRSVEKTPQPDPRKRILRVQDHWTEAERTESD